MAYPAFLEPTSVLGAVRLLAQYGSEARLLAGGAITVPLIQQRVVWPAVLISLGRIEELRRVFVDAAGALHIGAMASLTHIAADHDVRRGWSMLTEACTSVGNVRVRNQATLGGNLGEADYASDPPAVLLAADAHVRILSARGERQAWLPELLVGFGRTTLAPDELIVEIVVPALAGEAGSTYLKFKTRSNVGRPCVGVAAALSLRDGVCREARVAVGAACEAPQRFPILERELVGQTLTPARIAEFADACAGSLRDPIDDLRGSAWYRRQITRVNVRRAISALAGQETRT